MDENNNAGCMAIWGIMSEVLTNVVIWLVLAAMGLGFLLWRGVNARSAVAYLALGGILTLFLAGIGAVSVLVIQAIGERREAAREHREAQRFRENAKENLAFLQMQSNLQHAQAKVQLTQQKALLAENRDLRRLSAPGGSNGDVLDVDALVIDDDLFDELED